MQQKRKSIKIKSTTDFLYLLIFARRHNESTQLKPTIKTTGPRS